MAVSRTHYDVTDDSGVGDLKHAVMVVAMHVKHQIRSTRTYLAGNIHIGESDDKTVLRSGIFVFVLYYETSTCVVISFTFSTPFKLDLETFEVLLVLHNFDETLCLITW